MNRYDGDRPRPHSGSLRPAPATHEPAPVDLVGPVASDIRIPGAEVSTRTLACISDAELTARLRLSLGRSDKLLVERGLAADARWPSCGSSVARYPAVCAQTRCQIP